MSNEAVDINAEEYKKVFLTNKIKMAIGDFACGIKKFIYTCNRNEAFTSKHLFLVEVRSSSLTALK